MKATVNYSGIQKEFRTFEEAIQYLNENSIKSFKLSVRVSK